MNDFGVSRLATAVVLFAVSDLATAVRCIDKGRGDVTYANSPVYMSTMYDLKDDCEKFFHGAWFETLCGIDGDLIIKAAKEKSKENKRYWTDLRVCPEDWR